MKKEMPNDPTLPYGTAKGYVQSAYVLMASPLRYQVPNDTTFYLSFHMLCGFAAELYLKSFLMHKGFTEAQVRTKELGHNLGKLYELAVAHGLSASGTDELIKLLGEHHKNFGFRYLKPSSIYQTKNLVTVFSAFSSLDSVVDAAVGASVSRGVKPGGGWSFPSSGANWRLGEFAT